MSPQEKLQKQIDDLILDCKKNGYKDIANVQKKISELNTKANRKHKPLYKEGQYVILDISYATVLYKITKLVADKDKEKYYHLVGIAILRDDKTNPYKSEARSYNPYCFYADSRLRLFEGNINTIKILFEGVNNEFSDKLQR